MSMVDGIAVPRMNNTDIEALAMVCTNRPLNQPSNKLGYKDSNMGCVSPAPVTTREVFGIRPRPAPPTPRPPTKRIRSIQKEMNSDIFALHQSKKQKLEETKEDLDRQEIENLLATPLIERKRPTMDEEYDSPLPASIPQSILKKIGENRMKTPVKDDKLGTSEQGDFLTPRKTLRFSLPKEKPLPDKLNTSIRISARRTLSSLRNGSMSISSDTPELLETSGGSSSSSVRSLEGSECSMKGLTASTPLIKSLKHNGNSVDWHSILESSQPRTLFTVGVGDSSKTQQKIKPANISGTSKSHLGGFLKKMAESKEKEAENIVDKGETMEIIEDKVSNEIDFKEGRKGDEEKQDNSFRKRIRNVGPRKSSTLVEELLTTPRTRLRRRIGVPVKDKANAKVKDDITITTVASVSTSRRETKKMQMDVKEVEEEEDVEKEYKKETVTTITKKKVAEIILDENSEHESLVEGSDAEDIISDSKRFVHKEVLVKVEEQSDKQLADSEDNVLSQVEQFEDNSDNKMEGIEEDVEIMEGKDVDPLGQEDEETETGEGKKHTLTNATSERVHLNENDDGVSLKIATVCSLNPAQSTLTYPSLTPVSDPVMLGDEAPNQPLQDYYNRDNDEEDLYSGLEETEEAETPPKMDFDHPEGGFDAMYDELYDEDPLSQPAAPSQKMKRADSDSSVICIDSDSESESHMPKTINSTMLDYEEDEREEEEDEEEEYSTDDPDSNSSSNHAVRRRSFFHDKFREYGEVEDIAEEEETENESIHSVEAKDDDEVCEEEEEEDQEEDEEEDEEEENDDDEEEENEEDEEEIRYSEDEEVGASLESEESAASSDLGIEIKQSFSVEPSKDNVVEEDINDDILEADIIEVLVEEEPDVLDDAFEASNGNKIVSEMEIEDKNEIVAASSTLLTGDQEIQIPKSDDGKLESHMDVENAALEIASTNQNLEIVLGDKTQEVVESTSYNLEIEQASSVNKSEHIDELCNAPNVEEVVEMVEETTESLKESPKALIKGKEIDDQTLAALSLKRVEDDQGPDPTNDDPHTKENKNLSMQNETDTGDSTKLQSSNEETDRNMDLAKQAAEILFETEIVEDDKNDSKTERSPDLLVEDPKSKELDEKSGKDLETNKQTEKESQCKVSAVIEGEQSVLHKPHREGQDTPEGVLNESVSTVQKLTTSRSKEDDLKLLNKKEGLFDLENVVDKVDLSLVDSVKQTPELNEENGSCQEKDLTRTTSDSGSIDKKEMPPEQDVVTNQEVIADDKPKVECSVIEEALVVTSTENDGLSQEDNKMNIPSESNETQSDNVPLEKMEEDADTGSNIKDALKKVEEPGKYSGEVMEVEVTEQSDSKNKTCDLETGKVTELQVGSQKGKVDGSEKIECKPSNRVPTDLFVLGEGQMFFGSPENLKISATELATFQVGRSSISDEEKQNKNTIIKEKNKLMKSNLEISVEDKDVNSPSLEYSVAEMDVGMIEYNSSTSLEILTGTPKNVSTRKRKYKPGTPGIGLKQKFHDDSDNENASPSVKDNNREQQPNVIKFAEKDLKSLKKAIDRHKIIDVKKELVDSKLDYLELCLPSSITESISKVSKEPDRNRRAVSEQTSSMRTSDITGDVSKQSRSHTRKSLNTARIYPDTRRKSKRMRSSSECSEAQEQESNVTMDQQSTVVGKSADILEENEKPPKPRERRSSCSHKDRTEKLKQHHKKIDEPIEEEHVVVQTVAKKSKKSLSQSEELPDVSKNKRWTRKSSLLPQSPTLQAIVEEVTPKSSKIKSKPTTTHEPERKKWKRHLDFETRAMKATKEDTGSLRISSKAKSLSPPSNFSKRTSPRLSTLPILEEDVEVKSNVTQHRSSKLLSESSGAKTRKSPRFELKNLECSEEMFPPPKLADEEFINERKSKKTRSLPDLTMKKRSLRRSTLPKLPEEEGGILEDNIVPSSRSSMSTAASSVSKSRSSSATQNTNKTSLSESTSGKDKVIIPSNAAFWAEKMFGKSQANWWSRVMRKSSMGPTSGGEQTSLSSSSTLSTTIKNTRRKSSVSKPEVTPSAKKRRDADSESVKSDKSGKSTRSNRESSITTPSKSEKGGRTLRKRKEEAASPSESQRKRGRRKTESSTSTVEIASDEEVATDFSEPEDDMPTLVEEYAENRRLTRHQKTLLQRSLIAETQSPNKRKKKIDPKISDSEEDTIFTPAKTKSRSSK